ncbi:hypothetical protein SAMN02745248_02374 [Hathewaya proteolytica DSM 3090]|uniref:Modulator of FtsH protease n=1 Tax=Hathewaya proteolytica DSM 3090 TaxID=1121331 RepID=A0A1M6RUP0_9CLOT|nr:Bax inhibitor-1/YccA family protein [Hathewaya proteolytica]SHK36129.1 hypothetical protein SAMN02745248_02374 [Hathewaya proteolytica DSM 3090]
MEHSLSENKFMSKTMIIMSLGVFITFLAAYYVEKSGILVTKTMFFVSALIELAMVIALRPMAQKLSIAVATIWFVVYSAISGITFSFVFLAYDLGVIASVFLIAAIMFFCCAMIGITTKKDLSGMAQFLFMGLIGLLVMSIMSFFIPGLAESKFIAFIGILIFSGYTAYDMQKVKMIHENAYNMDPDEVDRFVVVAALQLYLDFINLFLYLLKLARKK